MMTVPSSLRRRLSNWGNYFFKLFNFNRLSVAFYVASSSDGVLAKVQIVFPERSNDGRKS